MNTIAQARVGSITAQYDSEARALYVKLQEAPVASSVECEGDFVVDVDARSVAVGVEALFLPITRSQLVQLAARYNFSDQLDSVWAAVQGVQP